MGRFAGALGLREAVEADLVDFSGVLVEDRPDDEIIVMVDDATGETLEVAYSDLAEIHAEEGFRARLLEHPARVAHTHGKIKGKAKRALVKGKKSQFGREYVKSGAKSVSPRMGAPGMTESQRQEYADIAAGVTRLTEVGKVVSAANAAKLKVILDAARDLFALAVKQADDEDPDGALGLEDLEAKQKELKRTEILGKLRKQMGVAATEAARMIEAEFSFDQRRSIVADRLSEASSTGKRCYIRDIYDDYVIYSEENAETYASEGTYKRSYTFADGDVTLGDPVPVVEQRTWLPVSGSYSEAADYPIMGDLIPLIEKAVRKDGTAPVKIISPGWGTTGYYGADVLQRDGPKVFKKGTHMHWDHPTKTEESERPERSLNTLAGILESDSYWNENGPKGPGLYADAKVMAPYREAVDELAPYIGTSIRAWGSAVYGEAEGRKGPIVESLKSADSVDFVTTPGRGGEVLQLFESARGGRWAELHKAPAPTTTTPAKEASEDPKVGDDTKAVTQLEEARKQLAEQDTTIRRLQTKDLLRDARDMAGSLLREADLPDFAKIRLLESVAGNPPATEQGELDRDKFKEAVEKAIKAEATYLTEAMGPGYDGRVRGVGPLSESAVADLADPAKSEEALKEAFASGGYGLGEKAVAQAATGRRL